MLYSRRVYCSVAGLMLCVSLATLAWAASSSTRARKRPPYAIAISGSRKDPDRCYPNLPARLRMHGSMTGELTLLTKATRLRDIVSWAEDSFPYVTLRFTSVCSDTLGDGFVVMYNTGSGLFVWAYLFYVRDWESNSWRLLCAGPVGSTDSYTYFDRVYLDDRSGSLVFASSHGKIRKLVKFARPLAAFRQGMDAGKKPGGGPAAPIVRGGRE